MIIDKQLWCLCKICGERFDNCRPGANKYKTDIFIEHINKIHNININEYFEDIRPICPCGICNQKIPVCKKRGSNFKFKEMACGRYPELIEWAEKAKETRKGSNNPMYGKDSWNKGLTKDTNEIMKKISLDRMGNEPSVETKNKMSESAKKRLIHGHTGIQHTEQSKELMRQKTIQRIKNGEFKQTKTKPHIAFGNILREMNIYYEEEFPIDCWLFDYYLPEYDIVIEIDGDYFHSNPKIYPNGPKTKTQKINWYRDIKKNKFCLDNNQQIVRFWECDILNNIEDIKCKLRELCQLKKLDITEVLI